MSLLRVRCLEIFPKYALGLATGQLEVQLLLRMEVTSGGEAHCENNRSEEESRRGE